MKNCRPVGFTKKNLQQGKQNNMGCGCSQASGGQYNALNGIFHHGDCDEVNK